MATARALSCGSTHVSSASTFFLDAAPQRSASCGVNDAIMNNLEPSGDKLDEDTLVVSDDDLLGRDGSGSGSIRASDAGTLQGARAAHFSASPSAVPKQKRRIHKVRQPMINVTVRSEAGEVTVRLPKRNNARWLALAATQRAAARSSAGHGSSAARVLQLTAKSLHPGRVVLPNGQLVAPEASVAELEGDEVAVELHGEYHTREDGSTWRPTWAAEAFSHSEAGRRRAEAQHAAERQAREDEIRARQEVQDERDRVRFAALGRMLAGDLENSEQLEKTLDSNWEHIRIGSITDDPEEIREIKRVYMEYFVDLSYLFKHFSGGSEIGRTDEMSALEFRMALMSLKSEVEHAEKGKGRAEGGVIFESVRQSDELMPIFRAANSHREMDDDKTSLNRFEFFEALLLVSEWLRNRRARAVGASVAPSPSEAFRRLVTEFCVPTAKSLGGSLAREVLNDVAFQRFLHPHIGDMRRVFLTYCRSDRREARAGISHQHTMSLASFCKLMKDSKLLVNRDRSHGTSHAAGSLTIQQVRRAFAGAQLDDDDEDSKVAGKVRQDIFGDLDAKEEEIRAEKERARLLGEDDPEVLRSREGLVRHVSTKHMTAAGGSIAATAAGLWEANAAAKVEARGGVSALSTAMNQDDNDSMHLVLSEFLEAAATCCLLKWEEEPDTPANKVRRGFTMILQLSPTLMKRLSSKRSIVTNFANALQTGGGGKLFAVAEVGVKIAQGLDAGVMSREGTTVTGLGAVRVDPIKRFLKPQAGLRSASVLRSHRRRKSMVSDGSVADSSKLARARSLRDVRESTRVVRRPKSAAAAPVTKKAAAISSILGKPALTTKEKAAAAAAAAAAEAEAAEAEAAAAAAAAQANADAAAAAAAAGAQVAAAAAAKKPKKGKKKSKKSKKKSKKG